MKRILVSLTLVGIVGCSLAGFAQTTSPTSDAATAAASATPATDAAPPGSAPDAAPAPAAIQVAAVDAAPQDAPATTPPAAEPEAAAPDAANASSTIQAGAIIPLIVMDDVPLTDAIRNLARQAEINYMLDPKIGFGQMGADGKITPQPNVTIRWEKITAGQALTALLNNHNLELVEDPKSKVTRVTTKNPAALPPLITKIIQLKYASPSNVVASVQATFTDKRSKVMPDVRTSQLVVVATEPEMVDVDLLVESLDLKTKQVLIEARILETGINPTTHKGIDWAGTLAAQNVTAGNNAIGGVLQDPKLIMTGSAATFFNPFFLNADGVSAVISFLNTYAEVRELSTPRTVTLDNEKATVEVGELYRLRMAQLARDVQHGRRHADFLARGRMEARGDAAAHFHAFELLEEVDMEVGAPELTVGDTRQA